MRHTNSKGVLIKTLHTAAEIALETDERTWGVLVRACGRTGDNLDPAVKFISPMWGTDTIGSPVGWGPEARCLAFLLAAEYVKTDSLEGYKAAQAKKHVQKLRNASFK